MIGSCIKARMAYLLVSFLFAFCAVGASISETCVSQTLALRANSDLAAAIPAGSCNIDVTQSKSCTFDFSTISSNFESVCTELGGIFYEEDVTLACKFSEYGQSFRLTYYAKNYPACFGGNCTDAEAMEYYDTIALPEISQQLASQGATCDVSGESAGVRSALRVTVVILSAIVAVASVT
jgi:hypothetical protein